MLSCVGLLESFRLSGRFGPLSCSVANNELERGRVQLGCLGLLGSFGFGLLSCGMAPEKLQRMPHVDAIVDVFKVHLDDGLKYKYFIYTGKGSSTPLFLAPTEKPVSKLVGCSFLIIGFGRWGVVRNGEGYGMV